MPDEPPLILTCENEPHLLRDICDELQGAGYRVIGARDGAELLRHLDRVAPDLILCDIMMPGVDGYAVLTRLRRTYPHLAHVPLIFLSALSTTESVIHGKRAGADDYLTKPINYDLLLSTVEARLRQSAEARASLRHNARLGRHLFDALTVGVLVYTPTGQMIRTNPVARQMLEFCGALPPDGLAEPVRRLGALAEAGQAESESLMLDEARGRLARLQGCPSDGPADGPVMVLVFLTEAGMRAPLSLAALQDLFALTPTEARVVRHLALGLRPEEIGTELGVAQTTIAFHLRNAFAKTKTHRQADLVALALALPVGEQGGG